MEQLTLYDCFSRDPREPKKIPPIAQKVLAYLDIQGVRLSELNKAFYQAINGQPFVPLRGERDRYALLGGFRRRHIEQIFEQTGWQIDWPLGSGYLRVGSKEGASIRPCYRVSGSTGAFRIGYAFSAKSYVGIKITQGTRSEYEIQRSLQGLSHILCATDCCEVVDPKRQGVGH